MSTSLSSLYIVNRRPAELCLESDVALCRGERCTQEGQTDGASLQPGSACRRLDAPKPPVALASEPAENRRALKSSSRLSGGAGTPGRGPGGGGCAKLPPPETTDARARGGPPQRSSRRSPKVSSPLCHRPIMGPRAGCRASRAVSPREVAPGAASVRPPRSRPLLHLAGRPPGRAPPLGPFGPAAQHFPAFELRRFCYLWPKVISEISKDTRTSREEQ